MKNKYLPPVLIPAGLAHSLLQLATADGRDTSAALLRQYIDQAEKQAEGEAKHRAEGESYLVTLAAMSAACEINDDDTIAAALVAAEAAGFEIDFSLSAAALKKWGAMTPERKGALADDGWNEETDADMPEDKDEEYREIMAELTDYVSRRDAEDAREKAEEFCREDPLELSIARDGDCDPTGWELLLGCGGPTVRLSGDWSSRGDPKARELSYYWGSDSAKICAGGYDLAAYLAATVGSVDMHVAQ